jgi:hypothetical protein
MRKWYSRTVIAMTLVSERCSVARIPDGCFELRSSRAFIHLMDPQPWRDLRVHARGKSV